MNERKKSVLYPAITWSESVDFIRHIESLNLKVATYDQVAATYGLSAASAKSFTSKVSAAKQYGLIVTSSGSTIRLTETARQILASSGADFSTALTCFSSPPLYARLLEDYDEKQIPSVGLLGDLLVEKFGIKTSAKEVAAKCFLTSAEQLNLIQDGVLKYTTCLSLSSTQFICLSPHSTFATEDESDSSSTYSPPKNDVEYITQAIPCTNGQDAVIRIPADATEEDLYLIRDILDVVLKRKFRLSLD